MRSKLFAAIRIAALLVIALALVAGPSMRIAQAQSAAVIVSKPLYAPKTAGTKLVASSTEHQSGLGSWNSNKATIEWYIAPESYGLSEKTIGEIASISYFTKNGQIDPTKASEGVDFAFYIYTKGTAHTWYGERLTAEPLYSRNYSDPIDTWNPWTTTDLTWYSGDHGVPMGWGTAPTLAEMLAPDFKWSTYWAGADATVVDYSSMKIGAFKFGTGSGWSAYFDGYLDSVEINFTDGSNMAFDLENQPQTVYVDDNWSAVAAGLDPDADGPAIEMGADAFSTLQAALPAVADGGTVKIAAGTYAETGQIVLASSVSIEGESRATTTFKPTANTGTAGDLRGWFLIKTGVVANISGLTFDGDGFSINQAIRSNGTGTLTNNTFKNIIQPGYMGNGIGLYNGMTVSDSIFENIGRVGVLIAGNGTTSLIDGNIYTGKGIGDWLDYGFEVENGAKATISNNVVTGNRGVAESDGSTSAGIYATTYFAPGTEATVVSNTMMDNTVGLAAGYLPEDTTKVVAHHNRIVGNEYGVSTTATAAVSTFDVNNNWWGCNAGPNATGCDVTDGNINIDTWLTLNVGAAPASVLPLGDSVIDANLVMDQNGADTTTIGLLPNGIPASFSEITDGSLSLTSGLSTDGVINPVTYTAPAPAGTYPVCVGVDNEKLCVDVTVEKVTPVAAADSDYTVNRAKTLTVTPDLGVLSNDTDANEDTLTAVLDVTTTHGTLVLAVDGSFTYTPDVMFFGTDSFTYHANDGDTDSDIVTVTITVVDTYHYIFMPVVTH